MREEKGLDPPGGAARLRAECDREADRLLKKYRKRYGEVDQKHDTGVVRVFSEDDGVGPEHLTRLEDSAEEWLGATQGRFEPDNSDKDELKYFPGEQSREGETAASRSARKMMLEKEQAHHLTDPRKGKVAKLRLGDVVALREVTNKPHAHTTLLLMCLCAARVLSLD